jgi:cell division protein FtsX
VPAAGPDIVAWLVADAAGASLAEAVAAWQGVADVAYVSETEAFEEFVDLFVDRPELVTGVSPTDLPSSLRIELTHPSFIGDVAAQLRSLSDVDEVETAVTPACNAFPGWNIVLFVRDDRALTRLRNDLLAVDGIDEISVIGRDEAFAEYLQRFDEWPDLAGVITVSDMSVSLRARTDDAVALTVLPSVFQTDPDVKGVQVFLPRAPACG